MGLEHLHPILTDHSTKEAVVTFFLASKIMRPEGFNTLLNDGFKNKFQQFDKLKQVKITVGNKQQPEVKEIRDNGFKFVGFDKEGNTCQVLQGINEENRFFYSFHTLQYVNWSSFREYVMNTASIIARHQSQYIVAYSLHYIDEFTWDDVRNYEPALIFSESKYLPEDARKASTLEYHLNIGTKCDTVFDRIALKVQNKENTKNINISHTNTFIIDEEPIKFEELLEDQKFKDNLEIAHQNNKSVLKELFTEPVCKMIKL